ncbi:hypothetical protein COY52_05120 [Candidatus Desantisbacteria bacterium CG_4_10_14_0_8_um_filter_48_22]|uniref:Gfo/Idh/MocA-like oxidoreductase N-terminal domain-containing protein n=1 Tax=Candidatus Desantisbacteria bacterium CG_4_10_14_0_8_um_filter_48_22 TaxID=1974543 RepID=A0A2M7SC59_9BACT|nr:MAG: hypothetical protein COS16_08160 [Candidatus Desantisbacteria bacterium CG02_land_8_20_14_3_00_49_13]PIZ17137.1 MAG: hypothetical protein COY52_05120 [Candidatus Desantisbacteria bacterium CG_4_10_14_0_8_um_filter_48_22]
MKDIMVGIIGLDTSHSIEFTRRLQAPDCPADQKVKGMKAVKCLRFPSPFQTEPDQDKRQQQMEQWGVKVTRDFKEAADGVDTLMLEINDPSPHLEYFKKAAGLGKPVFLDKPPADTMENAKEIFSIAAGSKVRVFSASSLRFAPQVLEISREFSRPKICMAVGPLGQAPAGSSVVWYGVHAVEMLERVMGTGAEKVFARKDGCGAIACVEYKGGRRGIIQLNEGVYHYGIYCHDEKGMKFLAVDTSFIYTDLLKEIIKFFSGGEPPARPEDSLEVQAILNAIDASITSGKEQILTAD